MNRIEKHPHLISLVWFITILGCLSGIIMAATVWWSIVDTRDTREQHFVLKGRLNAILSSFGQGMAERKLYYLQVMKETGALNKVELPRGVVDLRSLVDSYRKAINDPQLLNDFLVLDQKIAAYQNLGADCLRWRRHYLENHQALLLSRKEVAVAIHKIREEIDRSYGRQRLAKVVRNRKLVEAAGADLPKIAMGDLREEETADLTGLLRDVADLALLVEQLRAEELTDFLIDLKDNRLRTTLVRLRRSASLLPEKSKTVRESLPLLLDDFEQAFLGRNYIIDNVHQSISPGLGGYFNHSFKRLQLHSDQLLLRQRIEEFYADLQDAIHQLKGGADGSIDAKEMLVTEALHRTWKTILLIILGTGFVFVYVSARIIKAIRRQLRVIEDANLVLDARTKALLISQAELKESKIRLQDLSSNLLNAQENERKRIARELHDELGAAMAFLKMQVRSAERSLAPEAPEALHAECEKLRESINQIIENVRRLSRDLSPVVLEDLGLEAAVEYLAESFSELHGIGVEMDLDDINYLVKEEPQRNVYRIIQELLTNIGKHAAATQVTVQVRKIDSKLEFSVQDNGKGFDVDAVHNPSAERSMGLTTLAERVRIIGGTLDVQSRPGKGSKVIFTAPLF